MSALTLRLRSLPAQRLDMSPFTPLNLAAMTARQVAEIPLRLGNLELQTGELFEVSGNDTEHIVIQAESDKLDGIGTALDRGKVLVEGHAGAYLGRRMMGGRIQVTGNSGILSGSSMSGGLITIEGDAGDLLGGAAAGERRAMRGGRIHVRGKAGDRVGDRQRRGIIVIEGNAGDYTASRMVAGTIVILGEVGHHCGLEMRRGSLLLAREPQNFPLSFNYNGKQNLGFLTLLKKTLAKDFPRLEFPTDIGVQRWVGDLACDGRGEILVSS